MSELKERSFIKRWFNSYFNKANAREIEWGLTIDEFKAICTQACTYCARPAEKKIWKFGNKNHRAGYTDYISLECLNGIDRIDNTKGYTPENSAPCCASCNRMKSDLSLKDFIAQVLLIAKKVG